MYFVKKDAFTAAELAKDNTKPVKIKDELNRLSHLRKHYKKPIGYLYDSFCIKGTPIETLTHAKKSDSAVFIVHGGGFFCQTTDYHRRLMKPLIGRTAAKAIIADYGILPDNKYPSQINELLNVYDKISDEFGARIVVVGEGVGADLALALILKLCETSRTLPSGLVLQSPVADFTLKGDSLYDHFYFDNMFGNYCVATPDICDDLKNTPVFDYVGDADPFDPHISTIYADFTGFPKTYVLTGDFSIFSSDAETIVRAMLDSQVDVTLDVYPKTYGAYPLNAIFVPRRFKKIPEFIESILGKITDDNKHKKPKREKSAKRLGKIRLAMEPLEPQDEDVLWTIGEDFTHEETPDKHHEDASENVIAEVEETYNEEPEVNTETNSENNDETTPSETELYIDDEPVAEASQTDLPTEPTDPTEN